MPIKLNWSVEKNADGSFVRRKIAGDSITHSDCIDVEWRHSEGFPHDTIERPMTHPPKIMFETHRIGQREVIKDMLMVHPSASDSTIAAMLDERRGNIAKALKVSE